MENFSDVIRKFFAEYDIIYPHIANFELTIDDSAAELTIFTIDDKTVKISVEECDEDTDSRMSAAIRELCRFELFSQVDGLKDSLGYKMYVEFRAAYSAVCFELSRANRIDDYKYCASLFGYIAAITVDIVDSAIEDAVYTRALPAVYEFLAYQQAIQNHMPSAFSLHMWHMIPHYMNVVFDAVKLYRLGHKLFELKPDQFSLTEDYCSRLLDAMKRADDNPFMRLMIIDEYGDDLLE